MIWRYSWQDSIPCSITLCQFGLNFWLAATWTSRTFEQNLLFIPLCLFLFWYNGLVASHNFVHWQERPNILTELQDKLDTPDRVILQFPPTLAWLEHRRIEYQYIDRWQVHVN